MRIKPRYRVLLIDTYLPYASHEILKYLNYRELLGIFQSLSSRWARPAKQLLEQNAAPEEMRPAPAPAA